MPLYSVQFNTTAYSVITVESEDETDALEKAADQFFENQPGLCHQCSGGFYGDQLGIEIDEDNWATTPAMVERVTVGKPTFPDEED